uniref:Uncharacterized protein n=1 Tax=Arundo donax TaxID=35708 RepID=A0A0A9H552_ARUDO
MTVKSENSEELGCLAETF